jgi:hypothetical protein
VQKALFDLATGRLLIPLSRDVIMKAGKPTPPLPSRRPRMPAAQLATELRHLLKSHRINAVPSAYGEVVLTGDLIKAVPADWLTTPDARWVSLRATDAQRLLAQVTA